ncbi:MAG TPA: hypothetical protein VK961_27100 [Chthoniobacter sp.]|nr:hypothetical protein [Chthoniobacter sp.]
MIEKITPLFVALAMIALPVAAQDFTSPKLDAVTSWIGNSYGGAKQWVQQDIRAMAVMPDGTVFTNVEWDEAGGNVGEFRDGALVRYGKHTHGWGNSGGEAVAANSRYVYAGMSVSNEGGKLIDPETWPPKESKWFGISRRLRSDISQGAPFEGGKGGKGDTLKGAFRVVAEVPERAKAPITGLAANDAQLFVADPYVNSVKVFDADTMKYVTEWKVERPGPLALDPFGGLWMLQRKTDSAPAGLICFDMNSGDIRTTHTFEPEAQPLAFCISRNGSLFIADGSAAQQVRIFTINKNGSLTATGTFGEKGGIASGKRGAFGDRKLNLVTALGVDAKDNLYLAHDAQSGGGGTVLESYRLADGVLNWRLFGLTFVDMADVDAASDTDVFTKEEHFRLDYAQPAGREWSYAGFTIDATQFPQDPRLHLWSAGAWVRHIGGARVLFVNDMNGERLQVYRFDEKSEGEVAIPSGLFAKSHIKKDDAWPPNQPEKGEWIWRDANGNGSFDAGEFTAHDGADAPSSQGWWVDRQGGVWLATEKQGLRYFPAGGLDAHGNPQWDFATMQTFPHPDGFREVKRVRYDAASDTLYLGGTTDMDKNQHWKPMGPVLACYDGWLHGGQKLRWRVTLPYAHGSSGHESCEPMGFDVAGDFIFVPIVGASKKEGVKTGRVEVFRAKDGSAVGHFEPGEEVGEVGLQDIRETLTAHRRADGEYIVLIEDDYKSKVVMYRWKP